VVAGAASILAYGVVLIVTVANINLNKTIKFSIKLLVALLQFAVGVLLAIQVS
jgi:hypothetical protein